MSNNIQLRLKVPFEQKDDAKALGARWLPTEKIWYVPHGVDIEPFKRWWPTNLLRDPHMSSAPQHPQDIGDNTMSISSQLKRKSPRENEERFVTGPKDLPIEGDSRPPWEQ